MQSSSSVWDDFTIDTIAKVVRLTLLSPLFALGAPVIFVAQGLDIDSGLGQWVVVYALGVLALHIFIQLDRIWANKAWKTGVRGLMGERKIDWGAQIVLITGGASGIGKLLAETLALRHVRVIVLDKQEYKSEGDYSVASFPCDVSDFKAVARIAEEIKQKHGSPTVLVNCAGIVRGKTILAASESDIASTIGVNLTAHFWTVKAFLPAMIEAKAGHIVTIGSALGYMGVAQLSDYCATKSALMGFHEALRDELDTRYGAPLVRTTFVAPGQTRTALFGSLSGHTGLPYLGNFMFPWVGPHDVAKAIIEAINADESRYICIPFFSSVSWILRGMPSFMQSLARWMSQSAPAMQHFAPASIVSAEAKKSK
ncbi:hypothetical protein E5Q_04411 [Mixia osmundae IAM 14324]|uniref:Short-chain dehydrogenase/reductase 3 n=1 Tax=Mixia osmundae (strain CBS 9802 / IAM 14324 / JCM 22182 / KY 12970) TaxID=764103 RepID=G7E4H2_MIXOS|nr:hypothetical protein E5Q_04411 [Mixia osmundae IAM 14324]